MKKVSIDGGAMMQKDFGLCTSFNALYLAISEKVLTHTHTHTHTLRTWRSFISSCVRARERKSRSNSYKQRAEQSSLCLDFDTFLPTRQEENKHVIYSKNRDYE